jgi:hypothetical protein
MREMEHLRVKPMILAKKGVKYRINNCLKPVIGTVLSDCAIDNFTLIAQMLNNITV